MRIVDLSRILAIAGACLMLSACGGGSSPSSSSSSSSGAAAGGGSGSGGAPVSASGAGSAAGRALFTEACGQCHSVTGHNKPSQQGGDLLHFKSTRAELVQLTKEMPVIHHRLTDAQVQAVVDYLRALEGRR